MKHKFLVRIFVILCALLLSIGPAHLRKRAGRALNPEEEAVCRASLCRAGI